MEKLVRIRDQYEFAMFEMDGVALRNLLLEDWDKSPNTVFILDFEGVKMFATMFFNASIGWFILNKGVDETKKRITPLNLSKLGKDTWEHSFENAIEVSQNPEYQKLLGNYDPDTDD